MGTSVGYEDLITRSEIILRLFKEFQFQFFMSIKKPRWPPPWDIV